MGLASRASFLPFCRRSVRYRRTNVAKVGWQWDSLDLHELLSCLSYVPRGIPSFRERSAQELSNVFAKGIPSFVRKNQRQKFSKDYKIWVFRSVSPRRAKGA